MILKYNNKFGTITVLQEVDTVIAINDKLVITGKFLSFNILLNQFIEVYV